MEINLDYIPNAVTGTATMSSVLVATIAFLLNYNLTGDKRKHYFKKIKGRLIVIAIAMGFGIFIILQGILNLVVASLEEAFFTTTFGATIIALIFYYVLNLTIWKNFQED